MNNLDTDKGIKLLIDKIEADIAYFNWLNPMTPLTIEDVIRKLERKK